MIVTKSEGVATISSYPKLDEKDRKIIQLQEDLKIAEHRAFAAEVEARRARQKRRSQKKELRRLHHAINEKNNELRNMRVLMDTLQGARGGVITRLHSTYESEA